MAGLLRGGGRGCRRVGGERLAAMSILIGAVVGVLIIGGWALLIDWIGSTLGLWQWNGNDDDE
ncbi:hypothetical protein MINTM005_13960 [Mycobacterium intracellulare]|nr:hypothetical protein MINTM005_13960 [Mycobacterium intracellulare]